MRRNGIDAYRQTNVTTADPKRLILMCYEGAISNLKIAREKYAFNEYEAKAKAVQKAQDIITLLMQSLDFEKGGNIAVSLEALYNYMSRRLLEGDVKEDTKIIDEVIYILEELEAAWEEIFRTSENSSFIGDTGQEKPAVQGVAL
jgi:flagellar protein FliS